MIRIQTTLNNFSVAKNITQLLAEFKDLGYGLYIDAKGIIHPAIKYCPLCNSTLSDNGYNLSHERVGRGLGLKSKKGKLICPKKDCGFQLSIPKEVIQFFNRAFFEWFDSEIVSLGTKGLSPQAIAKHFEETSIISFSSEYIRLRLKVLTGDLQHPEPVEKPSGVVIHDEQFVKIKGVDLKRISTLDAHNPNVYYDRLHPDRTEETMTGVCQELQRTLKNFLRAAVMDGHKASQNAYEKVFGDVIIQFCLFHFARNLRDAYKEEVGYGQGKSCIPLEHLIGFFSILNIFFDHERELNELRKLQKELNDHIWRVNRSDYPLAKKQEYSEDYKKRYDEKARAYLRKIRKVRRRKNGIKLTLRTEEQAKELLKEAKKLNVFPKKVQKQINRLEKDWINFTHCLRDKSIPATTNKIEQYYALTLNWIDKNNLQSEEQFYQDQKFSLLKRYKIPFFKQGLFTTFLEVISALYLTFGIT